MHIENSLLTNIINNIVMNVNFTNNTKKFLTSKNTINNFYFVNNNNTDNTIKNVIKSIEWRNENLNYELMDYILNNKQNNVCVLSKSNCNYVIYFGVTINEDLNKSFKLVYTIIENLILNDNMEQYILLFDCYNLGMDYLFNISDIINNIKIIKENFPERLKQLIILNSNFAVNSIYDSIKYLLNERIQKKIIFNNNIEDISDIINKSDIEKIEKIDYNNIIIDGIF